MKTIQTLVVTVGVVVFLSLTFAPQTFSGKKGNHHWSYSGGRGPASWGNLGDEFKACREGKEQSPINIVGAEAEGLSKILFNYRNAPIDLINNGHTIQNNFPSGSFATIREEKYKLVQFHLHAPSENTVNGKHYPMEMHLVHANNDGELAVVGVFIEEGKFNPFFDRVIKNMPSQSGEHARPKTEMLSAAHLLPDDQLYYHFMGSLTTPPCSEGVNWNVLRQPIQVSSKQIKAFQKLYKSNSRPVQPLYGRVVKY